MHLAAGARAQHTFPPARPSTFQEIGAMHSILIADHEPHVRYALSSKVLQAGFGLITAHDGRQALTLACARRPDLIVVEYRLPLLDGVDLSMRLRQTRKTS